MNSNRIKHSENIGKKFGRLEVAYIIKNGKYYEYICVCECGEQCSVKSYSILNGKQVSCGCYQKEQHIKRLTGEPNKGRKLGGLPSFRYLWHTYNRNARKRDIEFSLTEEQFQKLTKGICYFCGQEPNREVKHHLTRRNKKLYNYNNHYLHNGVDRLDNNKGYTLDNCVSCCRTCNVAKGTQTEKDFLDWITKVYNYNKDKND
jgi:hypothetical protein